jgi:hypothetical protein
MNKALKALLATLLGKHCIRGKHTPEEKIILSKIKSLDKHERKQFAKEYKQAVNNHFIIRVKKRTAKSYDWHITLNPRKLKEIHTIVRGEHHGRFL